MADPATREEYEKRFQQNHRVTGFGIDTTVTFPCPFCAAPGWMTSRVLDVEEKIAANRECTECKRGSKGIVTRTANSMTTEFVQTSGPDHPDYLPRMRRVESA
jgi:hypothetical protein